MYDSHNTSQINYCLMSLTSKTIQCLDTSISGAKVNTS
jgi:hypothetical protein